MGCSGSAEVEAGVACPSCGASSKECVLFDFAFTVIVFGSCALIQGHATGLIVCKWNIPTYMRKLEQNNTACSSCIIGRRWRFTVRLLFFLRAMGLLHHASYRVEALIPVALALVFCLRTPVAAMKGGPATFGPVVEHQLRLGNLPSPCELCSSSVNHLQEVALSK